MELAQFPLSSLLLTENDTPAANRAGKSASNAIPTLLPSLLPPFFLPATATTLTTCQFVDCG